MTKTLYVLHRLIADTPLSVDHSSEDVSDVRGISASAALSEAFVSYAGSLRAAGTSIAKRCTATDKSIHTVASWLEVSVYDFLPFLFGVRRP